MSDHRLVWATLADLLTRLERNLTAPSVLGGNGSLATLEGEVRKLGKSQFKANMLTEQQIARVEQVLGALETQQAQGAAALDALVAERVAAEQHQWLLSLLPALDGLDNAIASGQKSLDQQYDPWLVGWLSGLRLVRERLLAVLEAGNVSVIPTLGLSFDPHLHIAVATVDDPDAPPGVVVAEERRGYRDPHGVLRYADVVVCKRAERE